MEPIPKILWQEWLELIERSGTQEHPIVKRMLQCGHVSPELFETVKQRILLPEAFRKAVTNFPFPLPSREYLKGKFNLGLVENSNLEINVDSLNLLRMKLCCGTLGVGKTFASYLDILNARKLGIPVVLMDPRDDGLPLSNLLHENAAFIDAKDLRINPTLKPCQEIPEDSWLNFWTVCLTDPLNLHERSLLLLKNEIREYASKIGSNEFLLAGFLEHLKQKCEREKGNARERYETLILKLDGIVSGLGSILSKDSMSIEDLFKYGFVRISLVRLSHIERLFLYYFLVGSRILIGIHKRMRGDILRGLVVTEESEAFIGKQASQFLGKIPEIVTLLNYGRDSGIALSFVAHNLSDLISSVKQASVIQSFRCQSYDDVEETANIMGIDYKNRKLLTNLEKQQFLLKTPQFQYPILGRVQNLDINLNLNWERIEKSREEFRSNVRMLSPASQSCPEILGQRNFLGIEEEALKLIHLYPFITRRELYKRLNLTIQQGTSLVAKLKEKGFVLEVELPATISGGKRKPLFLTEKIRDELGLTEQRLGRGSKRTQFVVGEMRQFTETISGVKRVFIEHPLDEKGSCSDLMIELNDGRRIAIEYFHLDNVEEGVKAVVKDREFDSVVIVSESSKFLEFVEEKVAEGSGGSVRFVLLKDFFNSAWIEGLFEAENKDGEKVLG